MEQLVLRRAAPPNVFLEAFVANQIVKSRELIFQNVGVSVFAFIEFLNELSNEQGLSRDGLSVTSPVV